MLGDFLTERVEVKVATYVNDKGTRKPIFNVIPVRCAAQPLSASRVHIHGIEGSQTAYTLWAKTWPAGIGVGDTIDWPAKGITLQILAKPRDEGGAGEVFAVDCLGLA